MPKRKPGGVPVTLRALVQRINRKLKADEEVLKATRGERAWRDLGDFYRLDWNHNRVLATHVDPVELGRELGVLDPFEYLADEEAQ